MGIYRYFQSKKNFSSHSKMTHFRYFVTALGYSCRLTLKLQNQKCFLNYGRITNRLEHTLKVNDENEVRTKQFTLFCIFPCKNGVLLLNALYSLQNGNNQRTFQHSKTNDTKRKWYLQNVKTNVTWCKMKYFWRNSRLETLILKQ